MACTGRCRYLDHQRVRLGLPGRIARDQGAGQYLLVGPGGQQPLGERWRQALRELERMAKESRRPGA